METTRSRKQKNLLACVIVLLVAALLTVLAFRLGWLGNTVDIDPGEVPLGGGPVALSVSAGDRFVVTVTAPVLEDAYGYEFKLYYNNGDYRYVGGLSSDVAGIDTIFVKPFDGYERVGATMVGDREGVTGETLAVCHMTFEALADGVVSGESFTFRDVTVVSSDLVKESGIGGWVFSAALASGA